MEVAVDHRLAGGRGTARTAAAACCQTRLLIKQRGGVAQLCRSRADKARELSAERAAGVVNHGQGLGSQDRNGLAAMSSAVGGCPRRRVRRRVGSSHSSPSMSAPTAQVQASVWGAAAPGPSFPGLRCSRGRRGPGSDVPIGATPDDGPDRPCRPRSAHGSDASCPLVVVERPGCGFPAIVRVPQGHSIFVATSSQERVQSRIGSRRALIANLT
jgi:hypothetical protein